MGKSKKERKKIKAKKLYNKRLLKKYPWLGSNFDPWSGRIWNYKKKVDYNWTWYDDFPRGWRTAFGMSIIKDIDKTLKKAGKEAINGFAIEQIKEKYGELRFYCYGGTEEVQDIINAYSILSRNICLHCGKPDVGYLTSGWIMPICEKCFENISTTKTYDESVGEDRRMEEVRRYRRSVLGEEGWKEYVVDISEYAEKVRKRYAYLEKRRIRNRNYK